MNRNTKTVQKPCISCVYFKLCGDRGRTMPCDGRVTKSQVKKNKENNK